METNKEKNNVNHIGFFKMMKREEELDEPTFDFWKSELQKELPNFWQEMKR